MSENILLTCRGCQQERPVCCGAGVADDDWLSNYCADCCPHKQEHGTVKFIIKFDAASYELAEGPTDDAKLKSEIEEALRDAGLENFTTVDLTF
jgi:hypothetical protein